MPRWTLPLLLALAGAARPPRSRNGVVGARPGDALAGSNGTQGVLAEASRHVQAFHLRAIPKLKGKTRSSGRGRLTNRVGGVRVNEDASERMKPRSATCSESFPAPQRGSTVCPSSCPFMRFDPDKLCHWKCVTEEHCLHAPNMPSSVAVRETGMCVVCQVSACRQCSSQDEFHCERCLDGFDFKDGECQPRSRHLWHVAYAILGVAVLLVLWYVVGLAMRPEVNGEVLQQALAHRSMSKVRHDEMGHSFYPLSFHLAGTLTNSGGVGVLLHFRFQWAVLLWSVFAVLTLGLALAWHGRLRASDVLETLPMHEEALYGCLNADINEVASLEEMRVHFVYATGVVYVVTTVGALWFALSQRKMYHEVEDQSTTMADFALWCSGFPKESWSEVSEDELVAFFRDSAWGDSVVGVSVVWDLAPQLAAVDSLLNDSLHSLDGGSRAESAPQATEQGGLCKWARLECVDQLWWPSTSKAETAVEEASDRTTPLLAMQTVGAAFVVLRTERELRAALEAPLPRFRGKWEIEVQHLECEPETVLWDGFAVSSSERIWHVVRGVGIIMLTIALWGVCFYGPYAYYIISWHNVAGKSQGGFFEGLLLGLVITVGNQIVYAQCASVAESAQFRNRDHRDMLNVILYTIAVLVNTLVDLWLVTIMATGWQQDSGVDSSAVIRNPSVQHALFVQLVAYLYPATLLLPFLLEPLVTAVLPFYLSKWLVRSRQGMDRWEAEQGMACQPFDLNRYGDITINFVLIVTLFFLTSVNMWWVCFTMLSSSVVIYAWDHVRFLRVSKRTCFSTNHMDICGQYMTALPCALLAGAFAFKLQGGQAMVQSWSKGSFLSYHVEWAVVFAACVLHLVVHVLALRFCIPRLVKRSNVIPSVLYSEAAASIACNWFNANPVQCLRSMHHHMDEPSHVYHVPGKEYLHRRNEKIHAYYEVENFCREKAALEDIAELLKSEWQAIRHSSKDVSAWLKRLWSSHQGKPPS